MFVLLVALMYGEKEGFESCDDQNLFLFTDSTEPNIFVRCPPPTPSSLPSSSSKRSPASSPTNSRDNSSRFHTYPDFCPRLELIVLISVIRPRRRIQRTNLEGQRLCGKRESMSVKAMLLRSPFPVASNLNKKKISKYKD